MQTIFEQFSTYFITLDWTYIGTFILLSYALTHYKISEFIGRITKVKLKTRYRILIIGIIYAILTFFIRGYDFHKVESLLQSFVFAIVFHKMLIEQLTTKYLSEPEKTSTDEV